MQILADKLAVKVVEADCRSSAAAAPTDAKFSSWLYRHYCLLGKQGQLNQAPDGCNLEAGRPSALLLCNSALEASPHRSLSQEQ